MTPEETPAMTPQESPTDEDLVQKCIEVMKQEGRASTSLFQRRLRIGYIRATTVIGIMEARGLVGPGEGAAPRKILMPLEQPPTPPVAPAGESGTPLTDAEVAPNDPTGTPGEYVTADFARDLEHRLAAANEAKAQAERSLAAANADIKELVESNSKMRFREVECWTDDGKGRTTWEKLAEQKAQALAKAESALTRALQERDEARASAALTCKESGVPDAETLVIYCRGMRAALAEVMAQRLVASSKLARIYDMTEGYADGAPDATAHDKLCNEVSAIAHPIL